MMIQVPTWWIWVSSLFFFLSIVWTIGLSVGVWMLYKKTMPLVKEAQTQVRRVSDQARTVAVKASHTADVVHAQTRQFLGNAESTGLQVTQQARTVGAALTGLLVAARVVNFVRKII